MIFLRCEKGVEASVAFLDGLAIAIEPGRQATQRGGIQVAGAALGVAAACDEAGFLKDLEVLRDGLQGDGEWLRELVHRGISLSEARNKSPTQGI